MNIECKEGNDRNSHKISQKNSHRSKKATSITFSGKSLDPFAIDGLIIEGSKRYKPVGNQQV